MPALQGYGVADREQGDSTVKSGTENEPVHPPVARFPFAQYASVLGGTTSNPRRVHPSISPERRVFIPRRPEDGQTSVRIHGGVDRKPIVDVGLDSIRWAYSLGSVVGELDVMWKWSFEQTAKRTDSEIESKLDRVQFDGLHFKVRKYKLRSYDLNHIHSSDTFSEMERHVVIVVFGAPLTTRVYSCQVLGLLSSNHRAFIPCKQRSWLSHSYCDSLP